MGLPRNSTARNQAGLSYQDGGSGFERVKIRILPDGRMTRNDAAAYLGRTSKTLAQWAVTGKGPRFVKVGGRVFYYRNELEEFIAGEVAAAE